MSQANEVASRAVLQGRFIQGEPRGFDGVVVSSSDSEPPFQSVLLWGPIGMHIARRTLLGIWDAGPETSTPAATLGMQPRILKVISRVEEMRARPKGCTCAREEAFSNIARHQFP
ncbi:hypothetical protein POX_a01828 [Penicillium oxalicum]|uniref:Uncharacterized protein n=1 Tax=Penicillium oxalicum (strain 114-2 / CGMCC 5302) TaxID=933388 RepID=S8B2W4_PENO1|nr:hypothetical protein POX_a01828 [Penicillium oxalicum]EPS33178.1 hypothetical protein PDE_08140 [Penicillium oxalicum 114-2]KAI2795223.1 hypothetical protein POX_a01828 [Penicillium oxalicum]